MITTTAIQKYNTLTVDDSEVLADRISFSLDRSNYYTRSPALPFGLYGLPNALTASGHTWW